MASAQEIVTSSKLGERIQKLMEKEELTQADLANDIGIARQTLSKYIKGERQPKADVLQSIADRFKMSVDELTERDDRRFDDETTFLLKCSEYTGISIKALKTLHVWNTTDVFIESKDMVTVLSNMIEDDILVYEPDRITSKKNATMLISSLYDLVTYKCDYLNLFRFVTNPETGARDLDHIGKYNDGELLLGDQTGVKKIDSTMMKEALWQDFRDRVKRFAEDLQKGNNDGKH